MTQPRWMKIVLWVLGAVGLFNGIAMFFAPSIWFFKMVPGVPETGPFNAHLVADSGTFFIAVGVGLLIAGFDPRRHVAWSWSRRLPICFIRFCTSIRMRRGCCRSIISAPKCSASTSRR
jgi:hypothetical protein